MTTFEVSTARGDQESQGIRAGIEEATDHEGPWEFAHYVERLDGEEWTPLIYPCDSLDRARSLHLRTIGSYGVYRNSRVIRRAVSPWEVVER